MARPRSETYTGEMEMQQPSTIVMQADGPIVREPEEIAVLDKPLDKSNADALAFMEDDLDIMIQPSSEENAAMMVDCYVNGEAKWVKVGERTKLKRKFVEVLLRAKPISVNTTHDEIGAKNIINNIVRHQRAKYPMSIMHDPSPKGGEWLRRVMMEQ